MAINFANVNISLSEFQRLSKGEFNAGEVRLKDEGRLRKMNNHIKTWWYNNNETISHAEVLAIKGAFVKALSQNGLDEDQINDVRRRIGLAPVSAGDRELRQRSIKPLMRTQIREILDQYAGLINDFNQQAAQEHGDAGFERILTSAELYEGGKMSDQNAEIHDKTNRPLEAPDRHFNEDRSVLDFQYVVAGLADFKEQDRAQLLDCARRQLDDLMAACGNDPSEGGECTAKSPRTAWPRTSRATTARSTPTRASSSAATAAGRPTPP